MLQSGISPSFARIIRRIHFRLFMKQRWGEYCACCHDSNQFFICFLIVKKYLTRRIPKSYMNKEIYQHHNMNAILTYWLVEVNRKSVSISSHSTFVWNNQSISTAGIILVVFIQNQNKICILYKRISGKSAKRNNSCVLFKRGKAILEFS